MNIECPKCKESFEVAASCAIPREQTMSLKLTSQSEMWQADSIGKAILSMQEILRGVSKNMGCDVGVFIRDIQCRPREIEISFAIINHNKQ